MTLIRQIYLFQKAVCALAPFHGGQAGQDSQVIHGFGHAHGGIHGEFLGKIANNPADFAGIFNGNSADTDFSVLFGKQTGQCFHQSGFSCTVSSQQAEHSLTNGEINIAQSLFFSIIFVQSFYFDQIVHTVSFLR